MHQWGSKSYYTKIGLDQLGLSSSGELVKAILEKGEIAPELRQLILRRSAGNPLFMEEFTHALLENGSIRIENDKFVLKGNSDDIQVPDTIQGIIAARMDQLEDNLKRTMQVASVIGRDFAYRILQTITGMREELKSHLLNLQGLEFVYEKKLFPELEYIFKHALTQEVAYNSLLLKRRKEIHEKIGTAIEELYSDKLEDFYEMLSYHYSRSDNNEKAVEYLIKANEKAYSQNAFEESFSFYEEAYHILKRLPKTNNNQLRLIQLIIDQTWLFQFLFKYPEYYELLKEHESIAQGLDNIEIKWMFYQRLSQCQWWFGNFDDALNSCSQSEKLFSKSGNKIRLTQLYGILNWIYLLIKTWLY